MALVKLSSLSAIVAQANATFPSGCGVDPNVGILFSDVNFHNGDIAQLDSAVSYIGANGVIDPEHHEQLVDAKIVIALSAVKLND